MRRRKIAVVTGSRAEYGLLLRVIKKVHKDTFFKLQLIVTGSHLDPRFGLTVREIEKDAFPIAARIKIPLPSSADTGVGNAIGRGIIGFTRTYARIRPDIIVLLGDRFEVFAAAAAAIPLKIPVAHIHGGESTEGAFDEQFRHAITKMSHVHFVSCKPYRQRIVQMGEDPRHVFCTGAPGIDNILQIDALNTDELYRSLRVPRPKKVGVVTYHPATLDDGLVRRPVEELTCALNAFKDIFWIITSANADTGGSSINAMMKRFARTHPDSAGFYASLGPARYLSLLRAASVMVGNSSSGIIEAPSFSLPVVNIGCRQQGRLRAANVIDVAECSRKSIERAIKKALSPSFKASLVGLRNPYGDGNASEAIVKKLKALPLDMKLLKKIFYENKNTYH